MFGFLINFFNIVLYQPLFNALVFLYNYLPGQDFGVAIVFLTLIIRLAIYPISVKALNSQRALQALQPKVQEIQKKYKNDKEQLAKETLDLYRKEKINPFSGLFLAIVQLPILIALYLVFWKGLNPKELSLLYGFIANPGQINTVFLSIVDLAKPNFILALLAGLSQFFQTKMLMPDTKKGVKKELDMSSIMQKQMVYFFPFITVVILIGLPSAIGLYWTVSSLFSIVQQYLITKKPVPALKT